MSSSFQKSYYYIVHNVYRLATLSLFPVGTELLMGTNLMYHAVSLKWSSGLWRSQLRRVSSKNDIIRHYHFPCQVVKTGTCIAYLRKYPSCEGSMQSKPKSAIGHDPEPVSITSHPQNLSP